MHRTVSTHLSGMKMNNNLWHLILIDNNQNRYITRSGIYKPVEMKHFTAQDCEGVIRKISNKMIYNDSFLIIITIQTILISFNNFQKIASYFLYRHEWLLQADFRSVINVKPAKGWFFTWIILQMTS